MQERDAVSFESQAMPHVDLLYRVARRLTRNDHAAEDLVQETFLKAYRAFERFEMREFGIKPWLLKILHNTFLNRQSRENRAPRATEQAVLEQAPDVGSGDFLPELDYERLDEEVKQAMDGLQPEFRSVLLLWATRELSYQEVAEVLGIPIGTVMSRLHRARQHLVRVLGDFARRNGLAGLPKP